MRDRDPDVPRWLVVTTSIGWRVALLAVLLYGLVVVLARVRVIVLPVIVALLLSAVLGPPARWLAKRGVPMLLATWLVLLGTLGGVGGLAWYTAPRVVDQVSSLGSSVGDAVDRTETWLQDGPLDLSRDQIDRWTNRLGEEVRKHRGAIVSGVFSGAVLVVELVSGVLITLVLTFFFIKDGPRMWEWVVSQLHGTARRDVDAAGRRAWHTLSGYILGSSLDGLVEAVLKAMGLLVLGVPLVLPLAALTFFGGYLPFVGAILAGVVSASVALAAKGPGTALLVIALSVGIQTIEGHLLQPVIMSRALKLHPVVVLSAITAGGTIGGLIGAFLAVPVTAVAVAVATYFVHDRPAPETELFEPRSVVAGGRVR